MIELLKQNKSHIPTFMEQYDGVNSHSIQRVQDFKLTLINQMQKALNTLKNGELKAYIEEYNETITEFNEVLGDIYNQAKEDDTAWDSTDEAFEAELEILDADYGDSPDNDLV